MAQEKNKDRELSWSEVRSGAAKTGATSLYDAALAPLQPFLHPIQTATTFKELGKGVVSKAIGLAGVPQSASEKASNEAVINSIGSYYSDRYGSMKGLKKALASDPAGVVADVAGVFSLGTGLAVRAPGMIGKAARVANKASMLADPTNILGNVAVRAPTALYAGSSMLKGPALSGVNWRDVSEARKAGLNKTPEFNAARTGKMTDKAIVDMADAALNKLRAARNVKYQNDRGFIHANTTPISYNHIEDTIARLRAANTSSGGLPKNLAAEKTLNHLDAEVAGWKRAGHVTAGDFDDLKQRISTTSAKKLAARKPSWDQAVTTQVLGSIRDTIDTQVPLYRKYMGDYGDASDIINDMKTSLSLGDKASYANGMSRLQIAFKGKKGSGSLDDLSKIAPELPAAIAGYNMRQFLPQGLSQYIAPFVVGGGLSTAAAAIGASPLSIPLVANTALHASPRALGRATYGLGAASRLATKWTPGGQRAVIASREIEEANRNRPETKEEALEEELHPSVKTRPSEIDPPKASPPTEGTTSEQEIEAFNEQRARQIDQLLEKTKGVESSGNYGATGPETGHGRAAGAYQVLPENIPSWTKEALGREMTEEEFRNDPAAQEAVARFKMEQSYNKHGNVQDVSSVWHSGVPLAQAIKQKRRDANMTTQDYVNQTTAGIGDQPPPVENPEFPAGDSRRYPAAVTVGDRPGRATGGRIMNHRFEADSLIRLADKTKKALNNSTESLLSVPDEAVTKALSIANEAI